MDRPAATPPASTYPAPSGSAAIYDRVTASTVPGSSPFVLSADGTLRLQYLRPDRGFFEYPGTYLRAESLLTLSFAGSTAAGSWVGTGILRDSTLVVKYGVAMLMADFEDGVHRSMAPLTTATLPTTPRSVGATHIHVLNAEGAVSVPLAMGDWPAWSPYATRIAFEHLGDGDMAPAQSYVMNEHGSQPRRLTTSPRGRFAESDPFFSPDGAK